MEQIVPEQIITTAKPVIPDDTSPALPSSEERGPVLQVLPTDEDEVRGPVERRMLEAVAGMRVLIVTELYLGSPIEKSNTSAMFTAERTVHQTQR